MNRRYCVEVEIPNFRGFENVPLTIVHGEMNTREIQRIIAESGWVVESHSRHEYRDACQYLMQTFTRVQVAVLREHLDGKGTIFVVPALDIGIGTPRDTDWRSRKCGIEPMTHWGGRECPLNISGYYDLRTDEEKAAALQELYETTGVPF